MRRGSLLDKARLECRLDLSLLSDRSKAGSTGIEFELASRVVSAMNK